MTVREFLQNNESSIGSNGAAWDHCDALNQLNKVRSLFYSIGDFDANTAYICVTCWGNRIYLPWFSNKILGAFNCRGTIRIGDSELFAIVDRSCCGRSVGVIDNEQYSPVPINNSFNGKLLFRIMDSEDVGSLLKVSYINLSGSLVIDEILFEEPFINYETSLEVREIKSISKPSTNGIVAVSYSATEPLFHLSPYVTSHKYRMYCLQSDCCDGETITLHIKKCYFPFTALHYDHLIDFPDHALSLAMEAIGARASRTTEGIAVYEKLLANAINFLKRQKFESTDSVTESSATAPNNVDLMEDILYGDC